MKRIRKINNSGQGGGMAAFAVCSVFLLLGAAAGCFSGSHTGGLAVSWTEDAKSFGEYLAVNLIAVGAALILGSSCIGFFLLPMLLAAAAFICAFTMTAAMLLSGGWGAAFAHCGWLIAIALPVFTVLCACAMRASAAAFRTLTAGVRPEADALSCFVKVLMISVALAVLLAVAAAAV